MKRLGRWKMRQPLPDVFPTKQKNRAAPRFFEQSDEKGTGMEAKLNGREKQQLPGAEGFAGGGDSILQCGVVFDEPYAVFLVEHGT